MNQTNPVMDQTLFDLKLNEANFYAEQGLLEEADNLYQELIDELKTLPESSSRDVQIRQMESIRMERVKERMADESAVNLPKTQIQNKSDEVLFIEASELKKLESYREAATRFEKLINNNFRLHETIYAFVSCYRNLGEQANAENYLQSLIREPRTTPGKKDFCRYYLSFSCEEKADYETALKLITAIQSPDLFDDYNSRKKTLQSKIKGKTRFDALLNRGLITEENLQNALIMAKKSRKSIEYVLINSFNIPIFELGKSLSMYYGYPFIDLSQCNQSDSEIFTSLKYEYLRRNHWAPLSRSVKEGKVEVVIDNPDLQSQQDIKKIYLGFKLDFFIAVREHIDTFIDRQFNRSSASAASSSAAEETIDEEEEAEISTDTQEEEDVSDFMDGISEEFDATTEDDDQKEDTLLVDSKVIMFVNKMIMDGFRKRASDIHIEPSNHSRNADIRFRIDGLCQPYIKIPNTFAKPVVSRIKIMAKLDITEKRKPMDGKIKFKSKKTGNVELRVATIPTAGGREDVVMRLLRSGKPLSLEDLGVLDYIQNPLINIIKKPYGLILVVGPTGSGKTTTLHSVLNLLNTPEKKIWTAEDPVEIEQKGIRQAEVHTRIGLDFATLLRSFLRADPDVIMVGEMRDVETTKTAIEASLTGHLVYSTLHTNNAPETITRLLEMDVDPTNFADSLLAIVAQRLGRTLCKVCKVPLADQKTETENLMAEFGDDPAGLISRYRPENVVLYGPKGCPACDNTGYRGRVGFHEFLPNNDEVRLLIKKRAETEEIREAAIRSGMYTLRQDGLLKVFQGLTDLSEVKRNCI